MEKSHFLTCAHCQPPGKFLNIVELSRHFSNHHSTLKRFSCGQCSTVVLNKTSLIRHIKDKHLKGERAVHCPRIATSSHAGSSGSQDESIMSEEAGPSSHHEPELPEFDLKCEVSKFLMSLRSSGNITGASVSIIQSHVNSLVKSIVHDLGRKTSDFLASKDVPPEDVRKFLADTFIVNDLFVDLETTDKQLQYFHSTLGLTIPCEKYLDSRIENRLDRKTRTFLPTQVPESFMHLSLTETLSFIVREAHIRTLIQAEEPSTDGIYRSYKDGTDFKNHSFLQKYPHALRIILNYDDLEVANGLGSKDVIHKLGCFYTSIQNLPPEYSSRLSSIFLLALSYAEDLKKKDAFKKVLSPFIEDLKKLCSDDGIQVDLPEGGFYTLRACLVNLCADALAAHALLGLMAPSALHFCRLCLYTLRDLREDSASIGQLRTSHQHERIVKALESNRNIRSNCSIHGRSALSTVMKVPEDCVFDCFHDLVGVIQMDVKLVLFEFICVKKLFLIFDFNSRLKCFVYGSPDLKNKPSINFTVERLRSNGHTLKQSGSQTFCLLRILPFLINGVEENDKFLKLIFLLQDIMRIMFSFEVAARDIDRLDVLTQQHNQLFHDIFVSPPQDDEEPAEEPQEETEEVVDDPTFTEADSDEEGAESGESEWEDCGDENEEGPSTSTGRRSRRKKYVTKKLKKGINKLHHILHSAKQLREKGPLIRLGCVRFEARHRIFRKHSAVQTNFKNVPKTMSKMFQLSTLESVVSGNRPREDQVSTDHVVPSLVKDSPYCEDLLLRGLEESQQIVEVEEAQLNGVQYGSGLFVVLPSASNIPSFGLIHSIVVELASPKRKFLVISNTRNSGLSSCFNAYKISDLCVEDRPRLVTVNELRNYRPVAPWNPVAKENEEGVVVYLYPRTVLV